MEPTSWKTKKQGKVRNIHTKRVASLYAVCHALESLKMKLSNLFVFLLSTIGSILFLFLERLAGIGWDYHPDAETYATNSVEMVRSIASDDYIQIFNNGYYFWAYFLNQNVILLTASNIVMYAISNSIIFNAHNKFSTESRSGSIIKLSVLLLLFNPYRLHLATTILKDTFIIFLVLLIFTANRWKGVILIPLLLALRIAGAIYLMTKLNSKQLLIILLALFLFSILNFDLVAASILKFNEAEMQLRGFDRIPTFQEYDLIGAAIRGLVWPLLAISGMFAIVSPALAFYPVAIGSIFNLIYCYLVRGKIEFPIALYIIMALFGVMVTGFTAYIRYIYPIIVIWPLYVISKDGFQKKHQPDEELRSQTREH